MVKYKSSRARSRFARRVVIMFYVYLLRSIVNKDVYVGYTTNLKTRFKQHNLGKVKSTKPHKPWTLIYYEAYKGKLDATKREKELKLHAGKNELLKHLRKSLV
jgi:putative endonuclease